MKKCKDCKYSVKNFESTNTFFCFFNPPVPFLVAGSLAGSVQGMSIRPVVSPNDFCSNFEKKFGDNEI